MSRVVRLEYAEYEVNEKLYNDVNEVEEHPQRPTQTLTCHQQFAANPQRPQRSCEKIIPYDIVAWAQAAQ